MPKPRRHPLWTQQGNLARECGLTVAEEAVMIALGHLPPREFSVVEIGEVLSKVEDDDEEPRSRQYVDQVLQRGFRKLRESPLRPWADRAA